MSFWNRNRLSIKEPRSCNDPYMPFWGYVSRALKHVDMMLDYEDVINKTTELNRILSGEKQHPYWHERYIQSHHHDDETIDSIKQYIKRWGAYWNEYNVCVTEHITLHDIVYCIYSQTISLFIKQQEHIIQMCKELHQDKQLDIAELQLMMYRGDILYTEILSDRPAPYTRINKYNIYSYRDKIPNKGIELMYKYKDVFDSYEVWIRTSKSGDSDIKPYFLVGVYKTAYALLCIFNE